LYNEQFLFLFEFQRFFFFFTLQILQHEALQTFDDIGRMVPGGIFSDVKYRAAIRGAGLQQTL
jgi:hypothetical protein